jgi:hypothetical protein
MAKYEIGDRVNYRFGDPRPITGEGVVIGVDGDTYAVFDEGNPSMFDGGSCVVKEIFAQDMTRVSAKNEQSVALAKYVLERHGTRIRRSNAPFVEIPL